MGYSCVYVHVCVETEQMRAIFSLQCPEVLLHTCIIYVHTYSTSTYELLKFYLQHIHGVAKLLLVVLYRGFHSAGGGREMYSPPSPIRMKHTLHNCTRMHLGSIDKLGGSTRNRNQAFSNQITVFRLAIL